MSSKDYFNRVATQWDEMRQSFFPESIGETALKKANVKSGKLAADIGAGTGFISGALIKKDIGVIAVDQSESMVAALKVKFKALDVRLGNAEKIPIETGKVDYVFANMCLHHVETPLRGIKEMTRILKTGGTLVITDLDEHNFEFLRNEHHDRWMGFKREDIESWFNVAGLKNIMIESLEENCCTNSSCGCQDGAANIFMATGKK